MFTTLYVKAMSFLTTLKKDQRGVTAIEYGLIAVAMAVLLSAVLVFSDNSMLGELKGAFDDIGTDIKNTAGLTAS
ncbi:Flp/Fap pilin component [Vibrio mediterranei]|jgi:pilus assembly protein Flp/PilA|uniref:Flp family type IVb pilin n=1 Tax=Vibrio mediterranei TaxID=689 RepID=A0ABX5DAR4_9VIBR|nr:Flp family type IVb pilin [Vibrio mediterranei]MCG9661719.1 Flp family type IVb pilin [Vibrio mediterranei]PCD86910.1 Flp family type IVb pilin [Vibrio mediterranei]PRQ66318.1 Flp family type IVb pilin [Vibrio mediterranei]PTC04051.1 Flp family type IVb pilin [Vibrio mediterranei]SBO11811.1 Flp/Fap pilin component [Vibrio mediterranei]